MDSKSAIMMSKLRRKSAPSLSAKTGEEYPTPALETIDSMEGNDQLKSKSGSLDILKSAKAGNIGGDIPSAFKQVKPEFGETAKTGEELPVMKTKQKPYSPIKNYLKMGR